MDVRGTLSRSDCGVGSMKTNLAECRSRYLSQPGGESQAQ